MKTPRRASATDGSAHADASLQLSGASARLRVASEEHEQLLRRVARKRRDLDDFEASLRSAMTQVAGRMTPIVEEGRCLDEEIHAIFVALLAGKHSRRARSRIKETYYVLQSSGVLSPRLEHRDDWVGSRVAEPGFEFPFDPMSGTAGTPADIAPSAAKPTDRGVLRNLYRRLVEALHPDQVQDEHERARRTDVMKDVTVAFREGNFARLIEIERECTTAAAAAGDDEHDVQQRLTSLLATNRELKKQLRTLEERLRSLRRSPDGRLLRDLDRRGRARRDQAVEVMVQETEEQIRELRRIHQHAIAFRDGKISLDDLVDELTVDAEPDNEIDLEEVMALFMNLADAATAATPRGGAPRGKSSSHGRKRRRP